MTEHEPTPALWPTAHQAILASQSPAIPGQAGDGDGCGAEGWTYNDEEVTCDLPAGHGGPHEDRWMGWEWL